MQRGMPKIIKLKDETYEELKALGKYVGHL